MEKYNIEIKEILVREIEIEAISITEAIDKVENLYNNEEVILDYSDHYTTDIDVCNLEPISNNLDFMNFLLYNAEKTLKNLSVEDLSKIGFGNLSNAINEFSIHKN